MSFRALVLTQGADRKVSGAVETLDESRLPAGDVTVAIEYSTLNYKDGLVLTTGGGLVKTWPHVGGIDFAGTVEASDNPNFKSGDKVVLNGWRVGELHWGGYATRARVKGDWLVKLPGSLSTKRAMAIGTAGYTSMLCIMALQKHGVRPEAGEVLVTGAAGGVGSVAVAILARLVPITAAIQVVELAGAAFTYCEFLHRERHVPPGAYELHPFFAMTAFIASLSNVKSATRCFSRRFSSSSCRRRLASLTCMPPYLLFHEYSVAALTPNSRATSAVLRPPSSCLTAAMIFSSL